LLVLRNYRTGELNFWQAYFAMGLHG